jgi:hypothetical protein
MGEIGFSSYCIEPFIIDIYHRIDDEIPDTSVVDSDNLEELK